jgi:uncharacterized protein involved in exopolysaccharide biosynthesis
MKKLVLILAIALPLFAQEPQRAPEPTPEQLRQLATVMRTQRDQLSQQLLDMQAQVQVLAAEVESLKKQLAEANAKNSPPFPKGTITEPKPQTKS